MRVVRLGFVARRAFHGHDLMAVVFCCLFHAHPLAHFDVGSYVRGNIFAVNLDFSSKTTSRAVHGGQVTEKRRDSRLDRLEVEQQSVFSMVDARISRYW